MKHLLLVTILFGLLFAATVGAAGLTQTPQQQRSASCTQQATAKALQGEGRQAYIDNCLKSASPGEDKNLTPQQQKKLECDELAGQKMLHDDERTTYMNSCLSQ